jgi:hypothetical protein
MDEQEQEIFHRINELAREEHALWNKEAQGDASEADRHRLARIQATLDNCWEVLRERKAREQQRPHRRTGGSANS